MDDQNSIDLETRIAHQEHTIGELNDALSNQQMQISELETQVKAIVDRVRALSEAAPASGNDDEPPPHY